MNKNLKILWNKKDISKFESPFGNFEVVIFEDLGPLSYDENVRDITDALREVRLVYALETTKNVSFGIHFKANEIKVVFDGDK